ncbi:MAG: hypothetical protein QG657_748 [Acidobacteriota bacterium]|nr:hypothetical protein [Acidobacteriota bacterium]
MYEIKSILQKKAFVKEIAYLREERKRSIFLRDCKVYLVNFSTLYIKEIWKDKQLLKYSYYWFTANNKLISGWDNAPHHNEISSFPDHKHNADGVGPSVERNLQEVIDYIERIFTGK